MTAATGPRARLGALLLRKGLVTPVELETALEAQRVKGGLLGEILVRSGLASRPAIEDALAEQQGASIEAEAGFGTGLRSQIAQRRPRRAVVGEPVVLPAVAAANGAPAVATAPPPRPVLEAVPEAPAPAPDTEPEPDPVVRPLHPLVAVTEAPAPPELVQELLEQVERWEQLAERLREERDELQERLAARVAALSALEEERERRAQAEEVLDEVRAQLEATRADLEAAHTLEPEPEAGPEPVLEHVVFVRRASRYVLEGRDGPPPVPGDEILLGDDDRFVVLKVARSPVPDDARPCAFLER
ncbi:MAG: hypothetical protein ACM33B_03395, partial [Pseudomonadota bacterium]